MNPRIGIVWTQQLRGTVEMVDQCGGTRGPLSVKRRLGNRDTISRLKKKLKDVNATRLR